VNEEPGAKYPRIAYAFAAVAVVALGLFWRSHLLPLPPFMRKYGGDALWAALVYCLIRFCCPRMHMVTGAAIAFGTALAVELSQLYHSPRIEAIRGFRLGALVLGSTFNGPDILAYAFGIVVATLVDRGMRRQ
jgi:hypothetical protein